MTFGQAGFDGRLARQQPVEGGVEFVVADHTEAERLAEARGRCGGRERAGGGQLRGWIEDARDQQGEDKVAAPIAVETKDAIKADPARGAEGGGDMAVRQRAGNGEGILSGGDDDATFEHAAQALDMGGRPVREVAQRALTDLAVLAVGLTQQNGRRRVPVRDGFDIHGQSRVDSVAWYKSQTRDYMATLWSVIPPFLQDFRRFGSNGRTEARVKEYSDGTSSVKGADGKTPRLSDLLPQHDQLWLDAMWNYINDICKKQET